MLRTPLFFFAFLLMLCQGGRAQNLFDPRVQKIINDAPTERSRWALIHAAQIEVDEFNALILGEYWHAHIRDHEEAFDYLARLEQLSKLKNHILAPLVFDFKDQILREAYEKLLFPDDLAKQSVSDYSLLRNLESLAKHFEDYDFFESQTDKVTILHGAYEGPNAKVGGLGSFLEDFVHASMRAAPEQLDAIIVTPFYDFLKGIYSNATLVGFFDHLVYSGKRSAVYEVESHGIKQFLIQPDPENARLFDKGRASQIYVARTFSEPDMMMMYYGSALAALTATYGLIKGGNVDILHLHSYQVGLAARLLNDNFNPVKIAATIHIYNGLHEGFVSEKIFDPVGLSVPTKHVKITSEYVRNSKWAALRSALKDAIAPFSEDTKDLARNWWNLFFEDKKTYPIVNLLKDEAGSVHKMIAVSNALAEDMKTEDSFFAGLKDKFVGVLSGIDTKQWDISDSSLYGAFAVDSDLSNLEAQTLAAKTALKAHGLINDADRPLFLYVGRFSKEKGLDLLPHIASEVLDNGGQMIVMGPGGLDDGPSMRALLALEENSRGFLRVFTDLQLDQLDHLGGTGVQKGRLIRFAADYVVIPSNLEACGLVAIETFCTGGIIAASDVQGLKQLCVEQQAHSPDEMFNCVKLHRDFDNRRNDVALAQAMVRNAFDLEDDLRLSGRKFETKKKIARTCKSFDWNAEGGAISHYFGIYEGLTNKKLAGGIRSGN